MFFYNRIQSLLKAGFFLIIATVLVSTKAYSAVDGAAVFSANCSSCHYIGKGVLIGPDLKDIDKRRPAEWIHKWVKSSKAVIASGDAYGIAMYAKFNKTEMPNQNVSDEEIDAVLAYVKAEGAKAPAVKAPIPGAEGEEKPTNWPLVLLIAAVILYGLFVALANVKQTLAKVVREKHGQPEPVQLPMRTRTWSWMKNNKKMVALIFIVLVVGGSVKGWYVLSGIGISQNYQPDQPIAFSHKIHAGDNKIACLYCHSGADKGKTAGVPSANVCMNCHKGIKEGTLTGTTEISKIYAALDYNPETQTYGPNPKPIKWTRVHNLPDFAYFNHSQHVKVGGVQCQTCHGPVEETTVAKQFAPLTMSWCINCHRETEVKMAGNHYYDKYHKYLSNKYGADAKITVEKIGGTECGRCHY